MILPQDSTNDYTENNTILCIINLIGLICKQVRLYLRFHLDLLISNVNNFGHIRHILFFYFLFVGDGGKDGNYYSTIPFKTSIMDHIVS